MSNGSEREPKNPSMGIPDVVADQYKKVDYIWFTPRVNARSIMQCSCGKFLEADVDYDKLAKAAVRHARKTGHVLNPRGVDDGV